MFESDELHDPRAKEEVSLVVDLALSRVRNIALKRLAEAEMATTDVEREAVNTLFTFCEERLDPSEELSEMIQLLPPAASGTLTTRQAKKLITTLKGLEASLERRDHVVTDPVLTRFVAASRESQRALDNYTNQIFEGLDNL